jgi:hypothetical protein
LVHAGATITADSFKEDSKGNVIEINATIDWSPKTKPRGFIHWVDAKVRKKRNKMSPVFYFDFHSHHHH